jgi:hypothetical protein
MVLPRAPRVVRPVVRLGVRLARRAVDVTLRLAGAVALFPMAAWGQPGPAGAPAANVVPSGLVVVIEDKPQQPLDLRPLNSPLISGVALQIHWSDLEPAEGQPDWSKLDQLFAAAASAKKWVQLLIFPGFFAPPWALQGVKTESFSIQYGPGSGAVETLPMPWDKVYLTRWFAFLKLLSDRYGKSPAFRVVAAVGPTSVSAEFTLPNSPEAIRKWQSDGYTPSKYVGAWQAVFQVYAADFPNQYVSLSEGGGLNINDAGRIAPRERERTRQAVVDDAMRLLGHRFALQMSDVHAGAGPHVANSEGEERFVIGYIGRCVTGFQLRTSAEHGSAVMGAQGNPPLALKKSLDDALLPNGAGRHVDYVEIYEPDILAPDLQPVLQSTAALFAR